MTDAEQDLPNQSATKRDSMLNGELVSLLRLKLNGLLGIYVFGSRSRGEARPDSDLDVAVLVAGYADPLVLWRLSGELAGVLGCDIDLLDLRAASTVMQYQVLTTGQCLWSLQPAAGLFESFVLTEKLALDEARGGVLSDIATTGSVYGR